MRTVVLDARDAFAQPLRGWGRSVLGLVQHLPGALGDDLRLELVREGGGPLEVLFEQVQLPRIARRAGADLVHAPNCFLPLRRSCRGVVTVHDLAFEAHPDDFARTTGLKYRTITRRAVRSADAVICVSAWTAADVADRYGVPAEKLHVVHNAPSLPLTDGPAGLAAAGLRDDGRPYLLAVGDLRAKKNLARLEAAHGALVARGALEHRLILAGTDTATRDHEPGRHGAETTGYLDDRALDALMRGADLLVHPSLYEGFGLVLVEAMARGVPVACADATALPETAGGAAELFDPLDVEAIADAILRALGRRDELAGAGRVVAAAHTWEATARATAAVYRQVLDA
ncbi:glycosyltransferase family 4 protein [Paraconexibacter algicola]|uniref:Glycosyltransferase family 1 protein n=1 Tax=Paraconexibacter algicola TaxID=2133960 RepID=A0A2T4UKW5_9ACTN|nr:glycosyltransferase family 1 protein [Paraconexibacter algicola]PTL59860.1 glycosyltransferase family 1 protein [Paraconexibacter algicola]